MDLFVWSGGLKHATSLETRLVLAYSFSKWKLLFSQLKNLISYSDQYRIFIIDESGNFIKCLCPIVIFDWNLANNNYWNGRCPNPSYYFPLRRPKLNPKRKTKNKTRDIQCYNQTTVSGLFGGSHLSRKKINYSIKNCAISITYETVHQNMCEKFLNRHFLNETFSNTCCYVLYRKLKV